MNSNYTIHESYTLPSHGLIYSTAIDPEVTLRSMTTEEEMRRLSPSLDNQYKAMANIIEACMIEKPKISVYDMHLGDYQFLLHKLRVVTYGSEYKVAIHCPYCDNVYITSINLDSLEVVEYNEDIRKLFSIQLPQSKKDIVLKFQTPRSLDYIVKRKKEILKKAENAADPTLMLTLVSMIDTVDGQHLSSAALEAFVRKLPMRDVNLIVQTADKINTSIGLKTMFQCDCKHCGNHVETPFRITSEFFGPSIY